MVVGLSPLHAMIRSWRRAPSARSNSWRNRSMGYSIAYASFIDRDSASVVREAAESYSTGPNAEPVITVRRGLGIQEIEKVCRRALRGTDIGHYQLAVHLNEVAERRLYIQAGCSSAVHFARAKLDLS